MLPGIIAAGQAMTAAPRIMPGMDDDVTAERLIKAYAKSIQVYEQAEAAFKAHPTDVTMWAYHRAADRFGELRNQARAANRFGDALVSTEDAALTPPPSEPPPDPS